jgi:two-component system response regulator YesN
VSLKPDVLGEWRHYFKNFVIEIKINKVTQLLSNARMSVKEVTAAVGWRNLNSFGWDFENRCGVSPTEFRSGL